MREKNKEAIDIAFSQNQVTGGMMEINPIHVRRISFIKYLYHLGVSESLKPEPLSSTSVLIFHDAIELLLQLASEIYDVGKSDIKFMEYWEKFHTKKILLPQKESMRKLNTARVNLKHHGNLPSQSDIESFRIYCADFFDVATKSLFDLDFQDISLIEFIENEKVREILRAAELHIKGQSFEDAIKQITFAFHHLIEDYENRKKISSWRRSPFYFGHTFDWTSSHFMGLNDVQNELIATRNFQRQLGEFVDMAVESFRALNKAVKIIALGIDYRKYSKFEHLTPHVGQKINSGEYVVTSDIPEVEAEEVRFCFDFVIEAALKLQEFDYSFSEQVS